MIDIGLIIFSRMDSKRLPGKALRLICNRPLLGRVIDRARLSPGGDQIVVATSDREIDDPIYEFVVSEGISVFRGPANDVAGRALACAEKYQFNRFVRITGDSPFFDPEILYKLKDIAINNDLDLATNVFPRSYPIGSSGEIVASRALSKLLQVTTDVEDREHVTRYFYRHPDQFRIQNISAKDKRYLGLSVSVDQPDDLDRASWIIDNLEKPPEIATLDELVCLAKAWKKNETLKT